MQRVQGLHHAQPGLHQGMQLLGKQQQRELLPALAPGPALAQAERRQPARGQLSAGVGFVQRRQPQLVQGLLAVDGAHVELHEGQGWRRAAKAQP